MIFVKNSRGGRKVNMINTVSKINLSKINGKVSFKFIPKSSVQSIPYFVISPHCEGFSGNADLVTPHCITIKGNNQIKITDISQRKSIIFLNFLNFGQNWKQLADLISCQLKS